MHGQQALRTLARDTLLDGVSTPCLRGAITVQRASRAGRIKQPCFAGQLAGAGDDQVALTAGQVQPDPEPRIAYPPPAAVTRDRTRRRPSWPAVVFPLNPRPARSAHSASEIASRSAGR